MNQTKYSCSYCGNRGHKINKCKDTSISALIKTAENTTIFSHKFFENFNTINLEEHKKYIKSWLNGKKTSELKILGYHFNLLTIRDEYIRLLPVKFIEKWINEYSENKLALISKMELTKLILHIKLHYKISRNLFKPVLYKYCLPKNYIFDIVVEINIKKNTKNTKNANNTKNEECSICFLEVEECRTINLGCNHEFCCFCIMKYMRISINLQCPLCRAQIKKITAKDNNVYEILTNRYCLQNIPITQQPHSLQPPFQLQVHDQNQLQETQETQETQDMQIYDLIKAHFYIILETGWFLIIIIASIMLINLILKIIHKQL